MICGSGPRSHRGRTGGPLGRLRLIKHRLLWLSLGWAVGGTLGLRAENTKVEADPADPLQAKAILAHLDAAVAWYRQVQGSNDWLSQPTDQFYLDRQHHLTSEALQNAFAAAQAESALLEASPSASVPGTNGNTHAVRLSARLSANTAHLAELQRQFADLSAAIQAAPDANRPPLVARQQVVQSEIDLSTALAQALQQATALLSSEETQQNAASISGQIEALRQTVPEAFEVASPGDGKTPPVAVSGPANGSGLAEQAEQLFSLIRGEQAMDRLIARTASLAAQADYLMRPLASTLATTLAAGQDAGAKILSANDTVASATASQEIERDAGLVRSLSTVLLPLRQEKLMLADTQDNLSAWRVSLTRRTDVIVRILFVRAMAVLAALGALTGLSELWRRATVRYVRDPRRRRQLLLIRRAATGTLMGLVIALGFVSDFGSLATFAGFLTAGIAVALQTVILSVAAYFFLIGRYGVRVGDRVTISGVTGEVIDIGLVRVFLLELAGVGVDLHPTGRIVVLANSALFSSTPLFKQLPGASYTWHELGVLVAPEGDSGQLQAQLFSMVTSIYQQYRPTLENQHSAVERLIDLRLDIPVPAAELRCTDAGLEVVIRYPVEIHRGVEIDNLVIHRVMGAIMQNAALKQALAGTPKIRTAVRG